MPSLTQGGDLSIAHTGELLGNHAAPWLPSRSGQYEGSDALTQGNSGVVTETGVGTLIVLVVGSS